MPIYGYRCEQCGHELEVLQRMSEEPLRVCPNCMGPLHKMIYPAGIIFKGSGYYTTDYKAAGSPSRHGDSDGRSAAGPGDGGAETAAKSGSAAESKSEGKTESKADSKSDAKPAAKEAAKPSTPSKSDAD